MYMRLKFRAIHEYISSSSFEEIKGDPQSTPGYDIKALATKIQSKEDIISLVIEKVSDGGALVRN